MIDINRIYGIDIELDNLKEFAPTVEFKQYDYQTSFIAFRFYKKGNLVENIGDNYIIGVFKDEDGGLFLNADGTPVRTYALRHEEEKGVVILPISREVINKAGTVSCEIVIVNEEGKKVTSPRFTFTIHPSLTNYKLGQEKESVCGTFISGEKLCGYGNPEMINISKYITYEKTTWVDGETVVNEKRLNNMEDGIYNVYQQVNSHSETLEEHAREIEWLKENGGSGSNGTYISSTTPENVIVPTGNDLDLNIDFYSSKMGKGTLKVFINDVESKSISINQGESSNIIEEELFTKGTNRMVVYVVDRAGNMSNSLIFNVRYGSTEITTTFDAYSAYDLGSVIRFYFTAKALDTSDTLKMYMKINDELQEPINCQSDIRAYFTFPNTLGVGSHYCETWVEDSKGKSNVIKFNLVIIDETSLVVASDTRNVTVEEGEQVSLDYKVYMKNNTSFITKTYVDSKLVNTGTCNLEKTYYKTSSLKEGVHTIKVEVWDVTETVMDYVSWTVTITESTYALKEPVSSGSIAMFSAQNKSNSDENKEVWIGKNQDNETVMATLHNFAFNSESGWVDDALLITGNSYVEVPFSPLKNNAKYGFTLDIEFVSKMIGVEDAEVLNLWNDVDNCGVKITTEKLIIRSKAGNECNLYFTDNENVSAIFVIDRDEKVAKIYINGVMCGAFALSDYVANGVPYLEDFEVENTIKLGGSGYCIIKNLRVYEVALTSDEILNNFISNETNKSAQKELVDFQKGDDLPTLTIYGDFSGLGKNDKKPCKIVYLSPDPSKYGESFTLDHKESTLQYQGTSSMAYPIKNYRINLRDENGEKWKYNPFNDGKGESRFTLKADFMSSGHWQNTGLAKWVNDNLYKYDTKDEKSMNPRKWYDINNGGKLSDTRETINGFPCRLILVNDGDTPLNEGQAEPTCGNTKDMGVFNFNSDKDNTDTFGLDTDIFPNAMSFEVTANSDTSAGAFVSYKPNPIIEIAKQTVGGTEYYATMYMSPLLPSGSIVKTDAEISSAMRYNENSFGVYGNTIAVTKQDEGVYRFSHNNVGTHYRILFNINTCPTYIEINDIRYNVKIVEEYPENVVKEPYIDNSGELAYLKESFELRYPDSDDVTEDWGFMGIETEVLKIDEFLYYGSVRTNNMESNYFNSDNITITFDNNASFSFIPTGTNVSPKYGVSSGTTISLEGVDRFHLSAKGWTYVDINENRYYKGITREEGVPTKDENPYESTIFDTSYGLKVLIDWVDNCTDEEFLADYEKYFNKHYLLRYYLLVITLGMVDNLGKNMMLDTWDGQIWYPRFYDMDTICSYDNSGAIKFDVDIEMEQGYWNTSSSRLWTKVRDLLHDELVEVYKEMRSNGLSYERLMNYFYGEQISKIPQKYYNMDADIKYLPYADQYLGKAHGDGYEHLKRWLKNRLIFTDTLFDYAPSYNNDVLTIRANTIEPMTLTIETYTPVYQHLSWYNGQMDKKKIDGKTAITFTGSAQTSTDQEVLIYGGSNIKKISGISSMNPNQMLIGSATRLVELDAPDCPLLTDINSNKANLSSHTYLNKLNLSNCPQLGGTLRLNNSQLIKDINVKGTTITSVQMPKSIRNLETLRLPNSIKELKLEDAGVLHTLDFDEGVNLQSVSMTNCNALENVINFDLLQTPSITLNNSYNNVAELYFKDTTNLSLSNMTNLERVIYTPNNEYETFELINVANAPDYKVTTFNCPKLSTFMTTAPYRESYNNVSEYIDKEIEVLGDVILTENYSPKGVSFVYDNIFTDFENDGYIEVEVDLSTCINNLENIISFGIGINKWSGWTKQIHMHYNMQSARMVVFDAINNNQNISVNIPATKIVIIRLDVSGVYINGTKCCENSLIGLNSISIGSQEGNVRSNAFYNYIKYYGYHSAIVQAKDYGNIHPNTTFTANSIDISNTQFTDVKLLCTTDTNTLKLPTTVKNFYCDSSFDLDTSYLEDGEYDVVHGELVEPYTTDYEGEVNHYIPEVTYYPKGDSSITTDFIKVVPETKVSIDKVSGRDGYTVYIYEYKSADTSDGNGSTYGVNSVSTTLKSDTNYIKLFLYTSQCDYNVTLTKVKTPNLIPSSADGSLIFSMYAPSNTVAPTSGTWDLKGLEFDNFHTYGINNDVKPSKDSYVKVANVSNMKVFTGGSSRDKQYGNIYYDVGQKNTRCITNIKLPAGHYVIKRSDGGAPTVYSSTTPDGTQTVVYSMDLGRTFDTDIYVTIAVNKDYFPITINDVQYRIEDMELVDTLQILRETTGKDSGNIMAYDYGSTIYTHGDDVIEELGIIKSLTMPSRYDDYNITIKNAYIKPTTHNTMLYPLLVNEDNPITGTLDYTNYTGKHLSWSFAYTDKEYVNIIQPKNELLNSYEYRYNAFYDTEYEFDNPYEIARYTSSASGVLPTFNTEFAYTYDEIDNGDGTYTTKVYADSLDNLPTKISFTANNNLLTVDKLNTSKVTTMLQMFRSCGNLKAINCRLDTSGVTNEISQIFIGCPKLEYVDATNLVGSNIKYATSLFANCTLLKQIDGLNTWDTSELTSLTSMFHSCSSLTSLSGIESWNVGKVKSIDQFIYNCTSLTGELDLSNWDISNCTNFASAFRNTGLTGINLTNCNPTTTNTNMANMFRDSKSMTKLIAPNLVNTNVNGLSYFLANCSSLTSLDVSRWNVSGSKDLSYMFTGCSKLTSLDVRHWDVSGATSLGGFLNGCSALVDLKTNFVLNKVSLNGFIYGCGSLKDLSNMKLLGTVTSVNGFAFGIGATSLNLSTLDCTYETDGMNIYTVMNSKITEFYPPTNISQSINLRYETKLSIDSFVRIFNNLITTTETRTITLHSTVLNKLTEYQIAIATNKGWSVTAP